MIIEYRPATVDDAISIHRLLEQLGYQVTSSTVVSSLQAIRQGHGEVIVAADQQQQVIGCVHILIELRLAEGRSGEIASLVVDAEHRGMGIGAGLLEQSRNWIRQQDCHKLKIRMNSQRQQTHQFYIQQGLIEKKTQIVFVADLA